ncbi:MAG: hypothetical protein ABI823_04055 [Bryobacteraceae bacterium]
MRFLVLLLPLLAQAADFDILIRNACVLAPGLFDPAKIVDIAAFENPHQCTEGFNLVLANGKIEVENGKMTDARGGRALRRQL